MERCAKEKEIYDVLKKHNIIISPLCDTHIESLYDLYINHNESAICESFLNDGDYLNMIGLYYHYVCKNEVKMHKYYEMAISLGNSQAMNNLGFYYDKNKDIPNMLKYYEMAVALGDSYAMNNLGQYYKNKNDIPNMLKYYEMAVALGNSHAMFHLGFYYDESKDIPNMLKYYEMAVALRHSGAMNNLGFYYDENKDISNMLKYYHMAIELKNNRAMFNLGEYFIEQYDIPNMVKYWEMSIEHGYLLALHDYLSEILKDGGGTIPYDKNKLNTAIRKADLKIKMDATQKVDVDEEKPDKKKLLQKCAKYAIHVQDEALFFYLYEMYKTSSLTHPHSGMTMKSFETFHLFYMARRPFMKIETCPQCMEEEKKIIPFDCFWHGYCVMCTFQLKKCAICKIPKNPHFAEMFDA